MIKIKIDKSYNKKYGIQARLKNINFETGVVDKRKEYISLDKNKISSKKGGYVIQKSSKTSNVKNSTLLEGYGLQGDFQHRVLSIADNKRDSKRLNYSFYRIFLKAYKKLNTDKNVIAFQSIIDDAIKKPFLKGSYGSTMIQDKRFRKYVRSSQLEESIITRLKK